MEAAIAVLLLALISAIAVAVRYRWLMIAARRETPVLHREIKKHRERSAASTWDAAIHVERAQRLDAILNATGSLFGLLDAEGRLLECNAASLAPYGLTREEVVGRCFWETGWWTHDAALQERLRQMISRVRESGSRERMEVTHPGRNGELRYVDFSLGAIRAPDGAVLYLVPEARDITRSRTAQRDMERSARRFHLLVQQGPLAVVAYGRDLKVQVWNAAAYRLYGYREAEALDKDLASLIGFPWERGRLRDELASAFEAPPLAEKTLVMRKDGTSVPVLHTAICLKDDDGAPVTYRLDLDLSTVQELENRLEVAVERYRAIAEASGFGVVAASPTGEYQDVNERYLEITGLTRESALGLVWQNAIHPDDRPALRADWAKATRERCGFVNERRYIRPDGEWVWVSVHALPVKDELGGVKYFLLTLEDITARRRLEGALAESSERFKRVFRLLPDLVTLSEMDSGVLLDANDQWQGLTGYVLDETRGRSAEELGFWVDLDERRQLVADVRRDGVVRKRELRARRQDGSERRVSVSASLLPAASGDQLLLVMRDITEERRRQRQLQVAEASLRASEARLAGIFAATPDPIIVSRISDGVFVDINDAACRQFGLPREAMLGRTSRELNLWIDWGERQAIVERLRAEGAVDGVEMWMQSSSGEAILYESSVRGFHLDEGGDLMLWAMRDITERHQIEAALRASEAKFSSIFEHSPVALALTEFPNPVYLDVNQAWLQTLRYSREEVVGQNSLDFGLWVDLADRDPIVAELQRNRRLPPTEVRYRRKGGEVRQYVMSGEVYSQGEKQLYLWSVADITEQRAMEEEIRALNQTLEARVETRTLELARTNAELSDAVQRIRIAQDDLLQAEKMAALGSIVAGVAHELNTPLGNSVTVASTLRDRTREAVVAFHEGQMTKGGLRAFFEQADESSDLLLRSLMQARDLVGSFKQVAVDQTSAQRRRFDLAEVLREVLSTLSPMLKKKPVRLDIALQEGVAMDSYPGPLGQIITNFVSNALLHAFEGRESGVMRLETMAAGGDGVSIVFSDNGTGIPDENQPRVFDPFFTTKFGQGGSGMGLNIVYTLVTRILGGSILVDSRLGEGTTFRLHLPLQAPHATE